jgi:hypothetical protein
MNFPDQTAVLSVHLIIQDELYRAALAGNPGISFVESARS